MSRGLPIIFSGHMVRALLEGRKTMTRRLAWRDGPAVSGYSAVAGTVVEADTMAPTPWQKVKPGDRLWVRETFAARLDDAGEPDPNPRYVKYRADNLRDDRPQDPNDWHTWPKSWSVSIHMPRWASRLTLVAAAVRMERLQDVTEADAQAEGVHPEFEMDLGSFLHGRGTPPSTYRLGFKHTWDRLHGDAAWDANPEVVALTFTVHHQNIDALQAAA